MLSDVLCYYRYVSAVNELKATKYAKSWIGKYVHCIGISSIITHLQSIAASILIVNFPHKISVENTEAKRPLENPRCRWKGNMKIGLKIMGLKVFIGYLWIKIGNSGGFLWTQKWTSEFYKRRENSWLAEGLWASQEGVCYMELLCYLFIYCAGKWLTHIRSWGFITSAIFGCLRSSCFDIFRDYMMAAVTMAPLPDAADINDQLWRSIINHVTIISN